MSDNLKYLRDDERGLPDLALVDGGHMSVSVLLRRLMVLREELDAAPGYSSDLHHWNKYHNPTPSGFMGGELYLGELCVNCKFSAAQKAIRELVTQE